MSNRTRNRLVASGVGAATLGVVLTTDNPIDLWWLHGPSVSFFRACAIGASAAITVRPRPPYLFLAGFPVFYWAVRALDLALEADGGEATANAISVAALALTFYCYWAASITSESALHPLVNHDEPDADG